MASKFPHLVHLRAVANGIVDGGLPQRMHADAAAAEAGGIDAGGQAGGRPCCQRIRSGECPCLQAEPFMLAGLYR